MRKKVIIFISAAAVLLFSFLLVVYMYTNKTGINESKLNKTNLNETKFAQTDFLQEISFTLVESKIQDDHLTLLLSIENRSNYEIMYGEFYILEMLIDGRWYEIYSPGEWYDIGYALQAGGCDEIEIEIKINNPTDFQEGTYRIMKDVLFMEDKVTRGQEGYIAADFELY